MVGLLGVTPPSTSHPSATSLASKSSTSSLANTRPVPTPTPKPPALALESNPPGPTFTLDSYTPVVAPESTPPLAPELNTSFALSHSTIPSLTLELFSPLTPGPSTPSLGLDTYNPPFTLDSFTPFDQSVVYPPGVTQPVTPSNVFNLMQDGSSGIPTPTIPMSSQLAATPNQFNVGNLGINNVACGPDSLLSSTNSTMFVRPETDHVNVTSVPNTTSPSAQQTACMNSSPPVDLLGHVTNEPLWMKKKRTLDYFREAFKLGDLSNVIEHWCKLEEMLGFPDTVSICSMAHPTTHSQHLDPTRISYSKTSSSCSPVSQEWAQLPKGLWCCGPHPWSSGHGMVVGDLFWFWCSVWGTHGDLHHCCPLVVVVFDAQDPAKKRTC